MSSPELNKIQRGDTANEGDLLWTPSHKKVKESGLTKFTEFAEKRTGKTFLNYQELWEWSVGDVAGFWETIWHYFGIKSSSDYTSVLKEEVMPGAQWFSGAELNFAEHLLRHEQSGQTALYYSNENLPLTPMSWDEFAGRVRTLANYLRSINVQPGDRVVAYSSNTPETMICLAATTAIGAIWSVCSPDFGVIGAVDRLSQLEPKVFIYTDSYQYAGKRFDRSKEAFDIAQQLGKNLTHTIRIQNLETSEIKVANEILWKEILELPLVEKGSFKFEQVPFDHPLWILFSSGTTGLPKAIVHSHGGILLEQLKLQHLHMDLDDGDTSLFYTTSAWMMWNFLMSSLLLGVRPVLYDGSPTYPDVDVLWNLASESKARMMGASPSYIESLKKINYSPKTKFDFSHLDSILPAGSPVAPWCTQWFYQNIKSDLWVGTGSGGTDCCTGFLGGVPSLPVYAGEIQARSLGVSAYSFDEEGNSIVDQVGELVITKPMPSMPIKFWNDPGDKKYKDAYFDKYPGIWRHGDFFKINERGGCFVLGRSDATLNRHGVRIGTAEIYKAVESLPEIASSLVVNIDLPGGHFYMPLFVELLPGKTLDEVLVNTIKSALRKQYTPRHVPDKVVQIEKIPTTRSGKKMEVPVRKILMGQKFEDVASSEAMADKTSMNDIIKYMAVQTDFKI